MCSTSFFEFSYPNLLFVFLNLLHIVLRVFGLSLGLSRIFFVSYFEIARDHGNSLFYLEE